MTGLLLAGIGVRPTTNPAPCHLTSPATSKLTCLFPQHVTDGSDAQRNFLVVDNKTETAEIEKAFQSFTQERKDIAVLLINQHVRLL